MNWHSVVLLTLASATAAAQSSYYNLDSGRPGRIEDATPTERYGLDIQFAAFKAERLPGGTFRFRADPKVSYGILPFTELEVRVPVIRVQPPRGSGAPASTGIASVGLGMLHQLNLETPLLPAFALSGELLVPAGSLAAPRSSYLVKGVATKTMRFARVSLNAGVGTYSVQIPTAAPDSALCRDQPAYRFVVPGYVPCGTAPPIIIDVPCSRAPGSALAYCAPAAAPRAAAAQPASYGKRWMAGGGIDHAFPLHSLLVSGDVAAERFQGLYTRTDWTAELGVRRQMTTRVVVDAGIARRFAGTISSSAITVGATYDFATPGLWR